MHDSFEDHKLKADHPRNQFQGYPILSDQITREGLGVVWRELENVLKMGVPGDITEFGCYAGTTSLYIRRLLNKYKSGKIFHVYDSFDGLPDKTNQDNNAAGIDFSAGKLYFSKADFTKVFKGASLQLPVIHKGWFSNLSPGDVPKNLAFAFLDGDFYHSILDSLKLTWPVLDENGVLLIDDFGRETLPGVERAVRDYFGGKLPKMHIEHNIAIICK